jgi:segregation and condensation protein B
MSTNDAEGGSGGPSTFTEEEVALVTESTGVDPELDEVDAAEIEAAEVETPFEKIVARSKKLTDEQVRAVVESLLFVASQPLTVDQLFETTGVDRERLVAALGAVRARLGELSFGIVLHEVGGAWQLRTAPTSAEYVRRFLKVKPQRLTRAAVETLSIIAYRQPVTRPEIEDIRGVDSGAVLKALLDRRLIKIVGKKEEVGRPILYGTTREFLEFFALKDLNALPTLREFQELTEESREIVEHEAPAVAGLVEQLADPTFGQRQAENAAASEAALEKLEAAMERAETTAQTAERILSPPEPAPQPGPPETSGSPEGSGVG